MLGSKSKLTASNSGGGSGSGRQTPGALGGSGLNSCDHCDIMSIVYTFVTLALLVPVIFITLLFSEVLF